MSRRATAVGLFSIACLTSVAAAQCGPFFSNASVVGQVPATPSDLQAVDLDRNGVPELIYASKGANIAVVSIFKTTATGEPQLIQTLSQSTEAAAIKFRVADVNRDGLLDLLVTQYSTGSVRVYPGFGDGTFNATPTSVAVGSSPGAIWCSDLNQDGNVDLLAANTTAGTYSVLIGNGDGTFQPRVAAPAGIPAPNQVAMADFNGDGRQDLVLAGGPFTVAVALGNGNGTFAQPATYSSSTTAATPTALVVTDISGDGVPDVLSSVASGNKVLVMMGRSDGTLATETSVEIPANTPVIRAFSLADFNLDDKPDLMVVQGDSNSMSYPAVMLNNGNGTFATPLKWNEISDGGGTTVATTADVNRDKLKDIVYVDRLGRVVTMNSSSGGPVRLGFGQPNRVFPAGWNIAFSAFAEGAGITYEWFKDGQPVLNTTHMYTDGRIIAFNGLKVSDTGIYQCKISNSCSSITTTSFLYVIPPDSTCDVDFNKDGFITFEDFDAFVQAFEEGC